MAKNTLTAILILLLAHAAFGAQTAEGGRFKVRVSAEQANIREKPDIGSAVLLQIPEGSVLESSGKEGEWFIVAFVRDDGVPGTGYIHESLVVVIEPREELPRPKPRRVEPPAVEKKPETSPPPAEETSSPERSAASGQPGCVLSFLGGGSYTAGGDLNSGARGIADYYTDALGVDPGGKTSGLHMTYILGVEAAIPLRSDLFLGVGVDWLEGRRTSRLEYPGAETSTTLEIRPSLRAVPLRIGLTFYPLSRVYLRGSLQYYLVRVGYFYHYEREGFWQEWDGRASSQGLGAEAAAGTDWEIAPRFSFLAEAGVRYARIGGFKGRDRSLNTEGESYTEEGTLYYIRAQASPGSSYPLLFVRSGKPAEAGVLEAREARVDFSGAFLRVGLRVRL